MKPINIGKLNFSENKKRYVLWIDGKKQKFTSLQEAAEHAREELKEIAEKVNKDLTINIFDRDKYLSSRLVVKKVDGKWVTEIISKSLFSIEHRRYFTANDIEGFLPMRSINPNGVARVNISKSRKYKKVFLALFTSLIITSLTLLIFSILKVNGVGMSKISILKKMMQGAADHDIFNTWIAIATFCVAVILIAHSLFILFKKREIRENGTFKNDGWSKLYINNELRKVLTMISLVILLAFSFLQTIYVHDSYVYSVRNTWYVAMVVVIASYLQIAVIAVTLLFMIIDFVKSQFRFRRRLKAFFDIHYKDFVKAVRDDVVSHETTNLFKDKTMTVHIKGIKMRFPKDEKLAEVRIFKLPSQKTRKKLLVKEAKDIKHIHEVLHHNKDGKTKVA